jgi:hypothetical protein
MGRHDDADSRLPQCCERDIKKPSLLMCRIIYVLSETCLITLARLVLTVPKHTVTLREVSLS